MTDYSSLHAKEATLVAASLFLLSDARSDDAQTDTYMIHYIVGCDTIVWSGALHSPRYRVLYVLHKKSLSLAKNQTR